jgi:pilus assembly protein CpaB
MPRRRGWILMLLGLVLAIGTGTVVYYLLQQAAPATAVEQLPPTPIPTKPIPVAARLLPLGTTITDTDIVTREVPLDLPLAGVVTDTAQLVGQVVIADVQQDEFFRPSQLREGDSGPLSNQIPEGRVLVAFPVTDLLNQARVVRENDKIDLLLTLDITEETPTETRTGKSTNYTIQNVNVFRLVRDQPTEENPNPVPQSMLVDMEPQDAVILKFVKDNGGTIDFSLRSPLDDATYSTEAITQDYLFDNYGFYAPRSSTRPRQQ